AIRQKTPFSRTMFSIGNAYACPARGTQKTSEEEKKQIGKNKKRKMQYGLKKNKKRTMQYYFIIICLRYQENFLFYHCFFARVS
ncbi:MAG: hypothetical protein KGO83_06065, partial [Paenibacillaceae bacterium]|nr:hypothetical protein [Paenibacillaceae bacterium]